MIKFYFQGAPVAKKQLIWLLLSLLIYLFAALTYAAKDKNWGVEHTGDACTAQDK